MKHFPRRWPSSILPWHQDLPIFNVSHCLSLQFYQNAFSEWFLSFSELCLGKCSVISFPHARHIIPFNYRLGLYITNRFSVVQDLEDLLDSKLLFNVNCDGIIGLIISNIRDPSCLWSIAVLCALLSNMRIMFGVLVIQCA